MQTLTKLFFSNYTPSTYEDYDEGLAAELRTRVEKYSFMRHVHLNPAENEEAGRLIFADLYEHCDYVFYQGEHKNIVAGWGSVPDLRDGKELTLIGGHYDGPPNSPGADDNGSAIASLISLAKVLNDSKPHISRRDVVLVAFNGEEVGFTGSTSFVQEYGNKIKEAVILEMVGYFTNALNSQTMPEGLPEFNVGDWLGVVSNNGSGNMGKRFLKVAKNQNSSLPVKALKIPFGLEKKLPGLANVTRSDHSPFWDEKIPAVMLTDTAEFRNANYHHATDTPDTLNYESMSEVVKLLEEYVG